MAPWLVLEKKMWITSGLSVIGPELFVIATAATIAAVLICLRLYRRHTFKRQLGNATSYRGLGLELEAKQFFEDIGWRTLPSAAASFYAERDGISIYVLAQAHLLAGKDVTGVKFISRSILVDRISYVKRSAAHLKPLIVLIASDVDMKDYFTQIVSADPAARDSLVMGFWEMNVLKHLHGHTLGSPPTDAATKWAFTAALKVALLCQNQASKEAKRGNIAAALDLMQSTVRRDPDNAKSFYILAGLHLQGGNLAEASACCERALELRPQWGSALRRLSEIALEQKDLSRAIELGERAIRAGDDGANAYHHLALTYMRCLNYDAAETAQLAAIRLSPEDPKFARRLRLIAERKAASSRESTP